MTVDIARVEIRCSPADKEQMRKNATTDGYPDRAFAEWARLKLLGRPLAPKLAPSRAKLLSVVDAAKYCGVSRQQVYIWIKQGKVTAEERPEGLRILQRDLPKR